MKNLQEQIKRILNLMNESEQLDEAGVARALRAMRGFVPSVRTLGFITAENPMGERATPEFNKEANSKLKTILGDGHWGYQKIKGKYVSTENSFLVRNISKEDLLELGKRFNQETVIYGERFDDGEYTGMTFQMIYCTPDNFGNVDGEMKVFVNRENADDFYSEIKGRKFMIPFYGVEEKSSLSTGDVNVKTDFSKSSWEKSGGKIKDKEYSVSSLEESYTRIPDDVKKTLEDLQELALKKTGSAAYNYRGKISNILKKYSV